MYANVMVGVVMGFFSIICLISLIIGILMIVSLWHIFKKAGQHGWAALIPFYNLYVLSNIAWGNGWLFLLSLIPIGNIAFTAWTYIRLSRSFGKGNGFGVGMFFLPFIFMPMLGFGKAEYTGPVEGSKTGMIITTAVTGVIGTILLVILNVYLAALNEQMNSTYYDSSLDSSYTEDADYDDIFDDSDDTSDNPDTDTDDLSDDPDTDADDLSDDLDAYDLHENTPIEGYDGFVNAELTNGEITVFVPMPEDMEEYGSLAAGDAPGLSIEMALGYAPDTDAAANVTETVDCLLEVYKELGDYYTDVKTDDMITGDGFALQQINYTEKGFTGTDYLGFQIIKCDIYEGYPVTLTLSFSNRDADENSEALFRSACELYGIEFNFGS